MKHPTRPKSLTHLKTRAAETVREPGRAGEPVIITHRGVPMAQIQDISAFEETDETLALRKILALGDKQKEKGRVENAAAVVARLRGKARD